LTDNQMWREGSFRKAQIVTDIKIQTIDSHTTKENEMNGIDLKLKFKNRASDQELRELQYNLMHRFGRDVFKMLADRGRKVPFVRIVDSRPGETWVEILVRGGYYHIGLEFGAGLHITVILLFLSHHYPEAEVWYRPEEDEGLADKELKFDKEQSLKLLDHFLDHGSLMFSGALTGLESLDGLERPICAFCGVPMMRQGGKQGGVQFYCAGCLEVVSLDAEEYRKRKSKATPLRFCQSDKDVDDEKPF